jgi:uncharacterized membrane protein
MDFRAYFLGPQLIGLIFVIIGGMQRYLPPKKINRWYGYRTLTAKQSQAAWDEGNRYSGIYMMRAGIVVLVAGFIVNAISVLYVTDLQEQLWITYVILFGSAMGVGIISTMATEKHLHKKFKKIARPKTTYKRR